ncbi:swarming motility protein SwrC [Paenibacillus sp. J31TS4]|uniref:efflux RND transporter permease subunit n=1 Tax=Paenibacillus sp. J31TS4 TaxID=2807195 RepID=UPI001B219667|nr:efflux RND transporter permease subunit [Paenibacillus sp. J31TS4]GIP40064.1 swarming motility protein SwrC [Paenibacillus sp. J31TS4]
MKGIIRFSLNNKFAIFLMTVIVTVSGLYAGMTMKQETIPDIEVPILTVSTVYPGAAPEEVLEKVTKPLEQRFKNVGGVDSVNSTSMENVSSITMQYDYGQNMDKAETELTQAMKGFALPEGAQEPKISRISLNAFPVVSLSVSGEGKPLEEITKLVETDIKPALEAIEGVGTVSVSGQQMKEVRLTYDDAKLKSLGLSRETVEGVIKGSAVKAPLGLFELGHEENTIVVDGRVTTVDDLKKLAIPVIPSGSGQAAAGGATGQAGAAGMPAGAADAAAAAGAQGQSPGAAGDMPAAAIPAVTGIPVVPLSDIAKVELVAKADSVSRTNGNLSVGLNITKAADANTVDVVNQVKKEAERIEKDNPGVQAIVLLDQGKPIQDSVKTMLTKAVFGALFAVIVILLFLRNFRTTVISIVSIPLSLVIGILILRGLDITLNIMTLGAMTVAIGRVVDDSIVVIENIYRRMSLKSEKLSGKALVISATREMFLPILSSTLVTIAVFLPLALVSGPIGQLFNPFALTMVFSLLASLLVAITVVPAMAHAMFRSRLKPRAAQRERLQPAAEEPAVGGDSAYREGLRQGLQTPKRAERKAPRSHDDEHTGKLAVKYRQLLNWSLNHKAVTSIIAIVLLAGSLALVKPVGVSFLPEEEQKYVLVTYNPGPGILLEDVEKTALEAEKQILARPDVTNLQYSIGGGGNPFGGGNDKSGLFYIEYKEDTKGFAEEKKNLIADLAKLDEKGKWSTMDMGGGLGGGSLSLLVYGDSMDEVTPAVQKVQALMENKDTLEKVSSSLSQTYAQYTLVADQQKLSRYGLTAGQIAMALSPVRKEPVLTQVKADGKSYDVVVHVDAEKYGSIADIENKTIASPLGVQIPLKDVVTVEKGTSPNTVTQKNGKLYAEVKANVKSKDVGSVSTELQDEVKKLDLPESVKVEFGGVTEQINDTFTQLGLAMAAAVAIVYLLLVITFGGALTPFAILFSLPFIVIGALLGLFVAGETISASALMGALMLIGIVVTNAIVLLDRVHRKELEGLSTREALLEAGGTRLRPILMTALATVGALLPLALGFESTSGSLISKGLGVTVIGGLISSTLLTLLIVPIVYEALVKFRRKPLAEPDEELSGEESRHG